MNDDKQTINDLTVENEKLRAELAAYRDSEAVLRERIELFRRLIAHVGDVVYQHEFATGSYVHIDEGIKALTGVDSGDMTLRHWGKEMMAEAIMHGAAEGLTERQAAELMVAGKLQSWDAEYKIHAFDGKTRWLSDSSVPVFDTEGKVVGSFGVLRDITVRRAMQEHLLQAQKMESIGLLAGGVAHDFNNMLTAILGYATLAKDELDPESSAHDSIEQVLKAAERSASLTQQLLAFARRQVIQPKVISVNKLVTSMSDILQRLLGSDIDLQTMVSDDALHIMADASQIEQVIVNLAINARDAMINGGCLKIGTSLLEIGAQDATNFGGLSAGEYILLEITDNGRGMDSDTINRIFEPFFTTKTRDKGTGLGLATCYGIVKQSGGHIRVFSEPGKGATFEIILPKVADPVANSITHAVVHSSPRGSETVLVVEDEPQVRDVAVRSLRSLGYQVLEACNGVDALRVLEGYDDEVHLLASDVLMPQMGGVELAARLHSERPSLRILLASGHTDRVVNLDAEMNCPFELISKPYTAVSLGAAVRRVLDNRLPASTNS